MFGTYFTLNLGSCPVNVSRMGAKDMRLLGQNKLVYYSKHIKRHARVCWYILSPKFYRAIEGANRYYTYGRLACTKGIMSMGHACFSASSKPVYCP